MKLKLENKVAIVTGASAGLGKAIALGLAGEGVQVAISGRNPETLARTAAQIKARTGREALSVTGDMADEGCVSTMVDNVLHEFGTVHILVNNVGQGVRGFLTTVGQDLWQASIRVNLMSAIHAARRVAPAMQAQKWGRIVNIAALSATEPGSGLLPSNVAKSGLLSFSKTLSRELAPDNILVNCVSPGLIDSPQNDRYFSSAEREAAVKRIPLGRFGRSEEFADVVTFLCSERAGYITGQNLIVDGGAARAF